MKKGDPLNEVEDFLQHFGVKGMKWGVKKNGSEVSAGKLDRMNRRADKGDIILDRSKSRGGAIGKSLGKQFITELMLNAGGMALSAAIGSPQATAGIRATTSILATASSVKTINDIVNINNADKRRKTS